MKRVALLFVLSVATAHAGARPTYLGAPRKFGEFRKRVLQTKAALAIAGGRTVGVLEMLGLKFKVKPYEAVVSESLVRGSRLSAEQTYELKQRGFSRIVGLTAERDLDKDAWMSGLDHTRIRIMDNSVPSLGQVKEFLGIMKEHDDTLKAQIEAGVPEGERIGPVYVHCQAGIGRTGIMVAAYRMKHDGWSAGKAIVEARKYGMVLRNQIEFIRELGKVIDTI